MLVRCEICTHFCREMGYVSIEHFVVLFLLRFDSDKWDMIRTLLRYLSQKILLKPLISTSKLQNKTLPSKVLFSDFANFVLCISVFQGWHLGSCGWWWLKSFLFRSLLCLLPTLYFYFPCSVFHFFRFFLFSFLCISVFQGWRWAGWLVVIEKFLVSSANVCLPLS